MHIRVCLHWSSPLWYVLWPHLMMALQTSCLAPLNLVLTVITAETDGELETNGLLGKGPFAAWDASADTLSGMPAFGGPAAMDKFLEAIRSVAQKL